MNIVDKLMLKTGKENLKKEEILKELDVISSLIDNVNEKIDQLENLAKSKYNEGKDDYNLARSIALDTVKTLVKVNLIGDDKNVER